MTGLDPLHMEVFILPANGRLEVCDDTHSNFQLSQGLQEYRTPFMTKSRRLDYEVCAWTLGTSELRFSTQKNERRRSPGSLATKKPLRQSKLLFKVYTLIDII